MDITVTIASFALGIVATFLGFLLQEEIKRRRFRKSIANAMLAEITATREHYMQIIGNQIDQTPDHTLPAQRAVLRDQHPFPIFDRLSLYLGTFPKEDARRLARLYTEAGGFVHSLRVFMARMNRIDELSINIYRSQAINDRQSVAAFQKELEIVQGSQLQFFPSIKSLQRRVTGELFHEVKSILEKYAN